MALAATLHTSARAEPPNLVFNGNFEESLSGWSRAEGVSWVGEPGGNGVARIRQLDNARGTDVLLQCLPVEGGRLYDLGASASVPEEPAGTGGVSVRVRWHSEPSCLSFPLSGTAALDFSSTANGDWQRKELHRTRAPEAAVSALVLVVVRADVQTPYALLLDDLTLARSNESETLTVPTVASLTGALGQRFQTDLWVRNPVGVQRRFVLTLYPAGGSGQHLTPVVLNLGPKETRYLPDVLHDAFGSADRAGALRIDYDPTVGPLVAAARVVTVHPEQPGNGMGVPVETGAAARASGVFLGVPGDGHRVNVGAFNPSSEAVTVVFVARALDGEELFRVERRWAGYEWFQIDDVLAPAPPGTVGSLEVRADRPVLPFAIAIDNRSADPTYLTVQDAD